MAPSYMLCFSVLQFDQLSLLSFTSWIFPYTETFYIGIGSLHSTSFPFISFAKFKVLSSRVLYRKLTKITRWKNKNRPSFYSIWIISQIQRWLSKPRVEDGNITLKKNTDVVGTMRNPEQRIDRLSSNWNPDYRNRFFFPCRSIHDEIKRMRFFLV